MSRTQRIVDYLLVTGITLLIWMYAEASNVQVLPAENVPVRVELPSNELIVVRQTPQRVSVRFKGAQGKLQRLRSLLADGLAVSPDAVSIGEQSLVLRELLPESEAIARLAVSAVSIDPPTMQITVDRRVTVDARLRFNPRDVLLVEQAWQANPSRVELTLPSMKLQELGGDPDSVELEVEPIVDLKALRAGVEQNVRARVRMPAALEGVPHVRVEPAEVELTFTIDKREDEYVLPSVPVWVAAPPSDLTNYRVQLDEDSRVLRDVRVSGPSDLVQQVRDKSIPVIAELRLSSDDLARAAGQDQATAQVRFAEVPPQLRVQSPTATVRFTVTRLTE